jgi:putative transposase
LQVQVEMSSWVPPRLTPAQLEQRRLDAARLLRGGRLSDAAVARRLGVSRQSVGRWRRALAAEGRRGLARRPHTGRRPRLTAAQWDRLATLLRRGAAAAGFDTERWTLRRIAALVRREFGVRYHFRALGRVLRAHGWTPQRPPTQARERDDTLIAAWVARDWPRIKRGLAASGQRLPSWTKRVTRIGPASAPRGRRPGARRRCVA